MFGEATAWSDVHSLRLHSTVHEVPHFKTACRLVLHVTETLYAGPRCCPTRVDVVPFQHTYTAKSISKTLCTFICYKNNCQQIFRYYFSTAINVDSFSSFLTKKIFPTSCVLRSPWDLVGGGKKINYWYILFLREKFGKTKKANQVLRSEWVWFYSYTYSYISLHKERGGGTLVGKSLLIVSCSPPQHWLVWFWMVDGSLFNQPMGFLCYGAQWDT